MYVYILEAMVTDICFFIILTPGNEEIIFQLINFVYHTSYSIKTALSTS